MLQLLADLAVEARADEFSVTLKAGRDGAYDVSVCAVYIKPGKNPGWPERQYETALAYIDGRLEHMETLALMRAAREWPT